MIKLCSTTNEKLLFVFEPFLFLHFIFFLNFQSFFIMYFPTILLDSCHNMITQLASRYSIHKWIVLGSLYRSFSSISLSDRISLTLNEMTKSQSKLEAGWLERISSISRPSVRVLVPQIDVGNELGYRIENERLLKKESLISYFLKAKADHPTKIILVLRK